MKGKAASCMIAIVLMLEITGGAALEENTSSPQPPEHPLHHRMQRLSLQLEGLALKLDGILLKLERLENDKLSSKMDSIVSKIENIEKRLEDIAAPESDPTPEAAAAPEPTPVPSAFLRADEEVQLDSGKKVRVDDILYGYELLFETGHMFSVGSWLGVQCQQDPSDAMVLQMLIWSLKPKVIVDIGTNNGGSAVFSASIMSHYAKPGEAVVITMDPNGISQWDPLAKDLCTTCTNPATNLTVFNDFVKSLKGYSTDPDIFAQVKATVQEYTKNGGHVLVNVDGDHTYAQVLKDLHLYGELVTVGSYMISQDTKLDRLWRGKVALAATREFVAQNKNFSTDRSQEKYLYSQHVEGFLKRVK